jgi:hypothetical protein
MRAGAGRSVPAPLSTARGSTPTPAAGVTEVTRGSRGAAVAPDGRASPSGGTALVAAAGAGAALFATPCVTRGSEAAGGASEVTRFSRGATDGLGCGAARSEGTALFADAAAGAGAAFFATPCVTRGSDAAAGATGAAAVFVASGFAIPLPVGKLASPFTTPTVGGAFEAPASCR